MLFRPSATTNSYYLIGCATFPVVSATVSYTKRLSAHWQKCQLTCADTSFDSEVPQHAFRVHTSGFVLELRECLVSYPQN